MKNENRIKKAIIKSYKGAISKKDFQVFLKEQSIVEDDELFVEIVHRNNLQSIEWKYLKTVRIPISKLEHFNDIYDQTNTSFNDLLKPCLYVNNIFSIEDEDDFLSVTHVDGYSIEELLIKDDLCCFPLDGKLIRPWWFKNVGIRSGYQLNGTWNLHTLYRKEKFIKRGGKFDLSMSIEGIGFQGIDVPLGKCII